MWGATSILILNWPSWDCSISQTGCRPPRYRSRSPRRWSSHTWGRRPPRAQSSQCCGPPAPFLAWPPSPLYLSTLIRYIYCTLLSEDELTFELESGCVSLRLSPVELVHQSSDHTHHPGLGQVIQPTRVLQHSGHRDVELREARRMRRLPSLPGPGLRGADCGAGARLHLPTLASPPLVWNENSVKLCRRLFHRNISEQTSERKYFIREQNQGFKTSGKLEMEQFYQKEPILIKLFSS